MPPSSPPSSRAHNAHFGWSLYVFVGWSLYVFVGWSLYVYVGWSLYVFVGWSLYVFVGWSLYVGSSLLHNQRPRKCAYGSL